MVGEEAAEACSDLEGTLLKQRLGFESHHSIK